MRTLLHFLKKAPIPYLLPETAGLPGIFLANLCRRIVPALTDSSIRFHPYRKMSLNPVPIFSNPINRRR